MIVNKCYEEEEEGEEEEEEKEEEERKKLTEEKADNIIMFLGKTWAHSYLIAINNKTASVMRVGGLPSLPTGLTTPRRSWVQ